MDHSEENVIPIAHILPRLAEKFNETRFFPNILVNMHLLSELSRSCVFCRSFAASFRFDLACSIKKKPLTIKKTSYSYSLVHCIDSLTK